MNYNVEQAVLTFKDFLKVMPESKILEQTLSQLDDVRSKLEDDGIREMQTKLAIAVMADLYDPISSDQANQQRIVAAFETIAYEFYERSRVISELTNSTQRSRGNAP